MGANTSDADKLQGLGRGRGRGRGSQLLIKQSPNAAGAVVWGDFYFDAAAGGSDAVTATGQGQSVAGTTARTINATAATSQAQSTTGTAQSGITGTTGTSQGQSSQATANGVLDGVIESAQGQTVTAFADTAITVDATVSTSQAQSVEGLSDAQSVGSPSGEVVLQRKRVYIKRGKQYLIFNTLSEADAYAAAEEAIETAKKSSRGAARRKAKALKVPSPEVVQAVEPEKLEAMLARFNLKFDLVTPLKNDDFAALHYIQEQLAILQDDEDIELLLLTL